MSLVVKFRRKPSSKGVYGEDDPEGGHRTIQIFVGPDEDHLACAGDVKLRDTEWEQLQLLNLSNVMANPALGIAFLAEPER